MCANGGRGVLSTMPRPVERVLCASSKFAAERWSVLLGKCQCCREWSSVGGRVEGRLHECGCILAKVVVPCVRERIDMVEGTM
eukprot:291186-Chlamydomonas_euryale.AAC.3